MTSSLTDDVIASFQVRICKLVLSIYRYLVMSVSLSKVTWEQLLRVLLHITPAIIPQTPPSSFNPHLTASTRLASVMFQVASALYRHLLISFLPDSYCVLDKS